MAVKAAAIVLLVVTLGVAFNSYYINQSVEKIYVLSSSGKNDSIEELSETHGALKEKYAKCEIFISLTVSHEDLTDIEASLAEMEGAIKAGDKEAAIIAKTRFENSLLHLGRLSSFNVESIF